MINYMKIKLRTILVLVFLFMVGSAYGQKSKPYSEDDAAKIGGGRMQVVTGKVVFLDDDNKKAPASWHYLVFKREGCEDCLIGIETDRDGNYKLGLGIGKYKLITQWKNCGAAGDSDCAGHNYLSVDQAQYLIVKRALYGLEFNIELIRPKINIKLPEIVN